MAEPVKVDLNGGIGDALKTVIDELAKHMPPLISQDVRMLKDTHGLSAADIAANILVREIFVFESCLTQAITEMRKLIEDGHRIVPFADADDVVRDMVRH